MRIIKFFIFTLLCSLPLNAQNLAELTGGQNALTGSSQYGKHSDLDKFSRAAAENPEAELTPLSTQQAANIIAVTRLPDLKLNDNIIRRSVMDYSLPPGAEEAASLYAQGRQHEALQKYLSVLNSGEGPQAAVRAATDIAIINFWAGKNKEALAYIEQAIEADGQDPFPRLVKIWILASAKNLKQAKKEYGKLLFLTADFEYLNSAKLALAQADYIAGKKKPALEALQNLYASNPYLISHSIYLIGALAYKDKDYKIAQTLFDQALAHDSNNYMAQKYTAMAHEKLKEYVPAWQGYASLFLLNTHDKKLAKKIKKLSKHLKASPVDYMFYTRLDELYNKKPSVNQSAHLRIGLYTAHDGGLTEIESFTFLPGAAFTITEEKLGKVITGDALTPRTIVFDKSHKGVHIKSKWNTPDFSTTRPFIIELDKEGYTILVKDIKTQNFFETNTGDKELKGSILVIPGEEGMRLINYTGVEDVLPSLLMSIARGVKEPPALEAAAIALRTRLANELKNTAKDIYDMPDNTPFFNYRGVNMQSALMKNAVGNTKGITLKSFSENPEDALPDLYRACGPVSDDGVRNTNEVIHYLFSPSNLFKYVFSNPPKDLISAPHDTTLWSSVKWVYAFPAADAADRFKTKYPALGKLKSVEPAEMSAYGRVISMRFTGSKGDIVLPFKEADAILTSGTLRSNMFIMMPMGKGKAKEYIFIGFDTGRGKGLCLQGAAGMAEAGRNTKDILDYYYPLHKASKEWTEQKPLL